MAQTTKKVKIIGTQQYINTTTGEIEDMQVTKIEERDFNFHKVWMREFIAKLELVGNTKTKLAFWIIDNLNTQNQLCMTYRQIAEKTGISLETVRITMKILMEADFLRKHNMGVYLVNPDIIYKGGKDGRLNVLSTYMDADKEPEELTEEMQLHNILRSIEKLQKQAIELQKRIEERQNIEADQTEQLTA